MGAYLTESRWLRLSAFTAFYFAQGVPIGLFSIAVPAWLASQNVSSAQIGAFIAITGLPWGFKLFAGPFMDRFRYPAMGRRRPWVMAAQGGFTLSLVSLLLVQDPLTQITLLTALGFCVNTFSALQDVAVDGMAIDVLPVEERGRANALMAGGQVLGYSLFGALTGYLLQQYGMRPTALVCAMTVACIFTLITLVRERKGEKLLPWLPGQAASSTALEPVGFSTIFRDLVKVLFLPMSLLLTLSEFFMRVRDGIAITILPVLAVQELGYSSAEYSQLLGIMGGIGAGIGVLLGPWIDRFGAMRFLKIGLVGAIVMHLFAALTRDFWHQTEYVVGVLLGFVTFSQITFVTVIALYMTICWNKVAATQFSIYMSLANLSRSIGAALFALVAGRLSFVQDVYLMAALYAMALVTVLLLDQKTHRARLAQLEQSELPETR